MRSILQIVIIILLLANIFLFYSLTVSFDRARQASILLKEKISGFSNREKSAQKAAVSGDFANMEYFAKNAVDGGELVTVIASDPPGLNPLLSNEKSALSPAITNETVPLTSSRIYFSAVSAVSTSTI